MKAKKLIKELFYSPEIVSDGGLFLLEECKTNKEFDDQIRCFFGEEVCEIITHKPKNEIGSGTYVYGYTGRHILNIMPDIILILYSDDNKENGKCVFLWNIEDC